MIRFLALIAMLVAFSLTTYPLDAGSKDGPRRWSKLIKKNSEIVYKITFVAGNNPTNKAAEFVVIGDGSTDVDIEVYDSTGKLISADTEYTDLAFVRWFPKKTEEFTIKVKNLGGDDNKCTMGHN
jgi:type 1 fimbria pilin